MLDGTEPVLVPDPAVVGQTYYQIEQTVGLLASVVAIEVGFPVVVAGIAEVYPGIVVVEVVLVVEQV